MVVGLMPPHLVISNEQGRARARRVEKSSTSDVQRCKSAKRGM